MHKQTKVKTEAPSRSHKKVF